MIHINDGLNLLLGSRAAFGFLAFGGEFSISCSVPVFDAFGSIFIAVHGKKN